MSRAFKVFNYDLASIAANSLSLSLSSSGPSYDHSGMELPAQLVGPLSHKLPNLSHQPDFCPTNYDSLEGLVSHIPK